MEWPDAFYDGTNSNRLQWKQAITINNQKIEAQQKSATAVQNLKEETTEILQHGK